MDEDERFTELMKKSSLGAPAARSITARVDPAHAEDIRRIVRLRDELAHGTTRDKLNTVRELVELLQSLGFAWRDEVPDDLVHLALLWITELMETNTVLTKNCQEFERRLARQNVETAATPMPHASRQQPSENTAEAGDRPLDEVELLTVQETAQALRVPMVTVHRLVQKGQLPAIRTGRSFRVPAYAVHKYLRKAATDRNDRNTNG